MKTKALPLAKRDHVLLSVGDQDLGNVPGKIAMAEARKQADQAGQDCVIRDPIDDTVLQRVTPTPTNGKSKTPTTTATNGNTTSKETTPMKTPAKKTAKAAPTKKVAKAAKKAAPAKKVAKSTNGKATRAKRGPSGMTVEILKLASRAKGVTPAELNTLTEWKGAPWKWLFSNPKLTGYCDRFGYKFKVLTVEAKDGEGRAGVAYHVTKK